MTTDIKLNDDHDIFIGEDNDLVVISSADQVAQNVKIRLLSYLGEWFLNIKSGTPYFQSILGQVYRPQNAAAIIRKRIIGTPGVDSMLKFDFDLTNRSLSIFAEIKIGETISTVVINRDI